MFAFTFLFQLPISPKALVVHDPSLNQGGQINSPVFAANRDPMQNGSAEAVICNSKVVKIMKDICLVYFISFMDVLRTIVLIRGIDMCTYICL